MQDCLASSKWPSASSSSPNRKYLRWLEIVVLVLMFRGRHSGDGGGSGRVNDGDENRKPYHGLPVLEGL